MTHYIKIENIIFTTSFYEKQGVNYANILCTHKKYFPLIKPDTVIYKYFEEDYFIEEKIIKVCSMRDETIRSINSPKNPDNLDQCFIEQVKEDIGIENLVPPIIVKLFVVEIGSVISQNNQNNNNIHISGNSIGGHLTMGNMDVIGDNSINNIKLEDYINHIVNNGTEEEKSLLKKVIELSSSLKFLGKTIDIIRKLFNH